MGLASDSDVIGWWENFSGRLTQMVLRFLVSTVVMIGRGLDVVEKIWGVSWSLRLMRVVLVVCVAWGLGWKVFWRGRLSASSVVVRLVAAAGVVRVSELQRFSSSRGMVLGFAFELSFCLVWKFQNVAAGS